MTAFSNCEQLLFC